MSIVCPLQKGRRAETYSKLSSKFEGWSSSEAADSPWLTPHATCIYTRRMSRTEERALSTIASVCDIMYVSVCTLEELCDSFNKTLCQTSRTRNTTRDQLARARCKDCHSRRQEASSARVLSTVCYTMAVPSWTTRSTLSVPPPLVRNTSNSIFLNEI